MSAPVSDGWEDVAQGRVRPPGDPVEDVALSLIETRAGSGVVRLMLSLTGDICRDLGWPTGVGLGMQAGTGQRTGWVRFCIAPDGRTLRQRGRFNSTRPVFGTMLMPPLAYASTIAPRTKAEYRIEKGALLVQMPWPPAEASTEEAAVPTPATEPVMASEPEPQAPAADGPEAVAVPEVVIRTWCGRTIPLLRLPPEGELDAKVLATINTHRRKKGLLPFTLKVAA